MQISTPESGLVVSEVFACPEMCCSSHHQLLSKVFDVLSEMFFLFIIGTFECFQNMRSYNTAYHRCVTVIKSEVEVFKIIDCCGSDIPMLV